MKKQVSELVVITKTKDLVDYIFLITAKSPIKFRYSFISKMHNLGLELIELLYLANDSLLGTDERVSYQNTYKTKLKVLDYVCETSYKGQCILFKRYENIAKMISGCYKLIKSWQHSDLKRSKE